MLSAFPVIVGPTAGGKSTLALSIARHLRTNRDIHAEIVTADSMQVYRGMDIGTAKPTPEELAAIPHHLIDLVKPTEPFSVDRWLGLAEGLIADLRARGIVPIVVGGTHFYVKALLEGLFDGPAGDPALRARLEAMDPRERRAELCRVDPDAAERLHPNDTRRTVRALEVHRLTGTPISAQQAQWDRGQRRGDAFLIGLEWPTESINRRINARVKIMVQNGLVEEVRQLWEAGQFPPGSQAREALGYKQLIACLETQHGKGKYSLDDAIERIKIETRRFAKSQRTWLRRLRASAPPAESPAETAGDRWLDAAGQEPDAIAEVLVQQWFTAKG